MLTNRASDYECFSHDENKNLRSTRFSRNNLRRWQEQPKRETKDKEGTKMKSWEINFDEWIEIIDEVAFCKQLLLIEVERKRRPTGLRTFFQRRKWKFAINRITYREIIILERRQERSIESVTKEMDTKGR